VGWDVLLLQPHPVPDLTPPCFLAVVLPSPLRLFFSSRVPVRRSGWPRCSARLHNGRTGRFGRACCVAVFVAAVVRVFLATAVCALQSPHRPCSPCLRRGLACACFIYPASTRVYFLLLLCCFGRVGDLYFIPVCSPHRVSTSLCSATRFSSLLCSNLYLLFLFLLFSKLISLLMYVLILLFPGFAPTVASLLRIDYVGASCRCAVHGTYLTLTLGNFVGFVAALRSNVCKVLTVVCCLRKKWG